MVCVLNSKIVIAVLLTAQLVSVEVSGEKKADTSSGGGGFPLTASVTSMWGKVNEVAPPGGERLTFMIYFRGEQGWHDRKWTSDLQPNAEPFVHEFACDLTTLRAEVTRASRQLTVFGSRFDLNDTNVVLVENVDHPGSERIIGLGKYTLDVPDGSNPAVWLLQENEVLLARVMGANE